jgi:hypothetical protein
MYREGNSPQDTLRSGIDSFKISVCPRNYFSFVTFGDSGTTLQITNKKITQGFPVRLLKSARELEQKQYITLKEKLREGKGFERDTLYSDWILGILLISAFLITFVRSNGGKAVKNIFNSLFFQSPRTNATRDIGGLFHWQSTLVNLFSFINIGLFLYFIQRYYSLSPEGFPQPIIWLIAFLVVVTVITIRHFICILAGNISGEQEAFREYLFRIYQMYRLLGLFCFAILIILSYTSFIKPEVCFISGLAMVAIVYIIRIIRLMIIFINRHISIFYFILYLCALEILPAVVLIKYVTGIK